MEAFTLRFFSHVLEDLAVGHCLEKPEHSRSSGQCKNNTQDSQS